MGAAKRVAVILFRGENYLKEDVLPRTLRLIWQAGEEEQELV
jgi:hypothetical protein